MIHRQQTVDLAALNMLGELGADVSDLDAFFRRAADIVCKTAGCDAVNIFVVDPDAEELVLAHDSDLSALSGAGPHRFPLSTGIGSVARTRAARRARIEDHPERIREALARAGLRTFAWVPLAARSKVVGVMAAAWRAELPEAECPVDLLQAMGVHFAGAIEAHGLLEDLRRRVSDLESVHALALRIFGGEPGDVRALLDEGCRHLARALSVRAAAILLMEDGGRTLRCAAAHGAPLAPEKLVLPLERDGLALEAIRSRAAVFSEDVTRDPRSAMNGHPGVPPLTMLAVPLVSRASVRGVLYLADGAGRRFTEAERALAVALGGELAMGIENAELYAETRRRAEELGLVHEVGRSLVATLEIDDVLDAGVRNLARIVDAPVAFLCLADESGACLEIRAAAGGPPGMLGRRVPLKPEGTTLSSLVFEQRVPIVIPDALADDRVDQSLRARTGARAYLGLPLLVRDRNIGSAVIVETRGPRVFTPAEVERATAIANQLAVAVEHARLYEDLRKSYADLAQAQRRLIAQERLAALGELSAVVAHEVRNPLGVIFNSLGSLRRLVQPTGDAAMLLDIVGEEADRLNRIVGDLLDFARPVRPVLRPEPLERVVDEAVSAALAQNPGVTLVREIEKGLPDVPMDVRLIRQAVLNLAVNAVQAMPRGGRLTVRAAPSSGAVVLEIEDSGAGIPDEVQHRIFEPFFTTKASGTGLGLAVVKRILDVHGGEVAVSSVPGSGTVFTLRFLLPHHAFVETKPAIG